MVQGRATPHTSPSARGRLGNCANALRSLADRSCRCSDILFSSVPAQLHAVLSGYFGYDVKCFGSLAKTQRKLVNHLGRDLLHRILAIHSRQNETLELPFVVWSRDI